MTTYPKKPCACGREIGSNVIRSHRRKCFVMLSEWAKKGKPMYLLDERTDEAKAKHPLPEPTRT